MKLRSRRRLKPYVKHEYEVFNPRLSLHPTQQDYFALVTVAVKVPYGLSDDERLEFAEDLKTEVLSKFQ